MLVVVVELVCSHRDCPNAKYLDIAGLKVDLGFGFALLVSHPSFLCGEVL